MIRRPGHVAVAVAGCVLVFGACTGSGDEGGSDAATTTVVVGSTAPARDRFDRARRSGIGKPDSA